jgi:hypothetical protein
VNVIGESSPPLPFSSIFFLSFLSFAFSLSQCPDNLESMDHRSSSLFSRRSILSEGENVDYSDQVKHISESVNWILLDGNPLPSWFDFFQTIFSHKELHFDNGERFLLDALNNPNFIVECSSLEGASPAAITNSAIVHLPVVAVHWKGYIKSFIARLPAFYTAILKAQLQIQAISLVDGCLSCIRGLKKSSKLAHFQSDEKFLVMYMLRLLSSFLMNGNTTETQAGDSDTTSEKRGKAGSPRSLNYAKVMTKFAQDAKVKEKVEAQLILSVVYSFGMLLPSSARGRFETSLKYTIDRIDFLVKSKIPADASLFSVYYDVRTSTFETWNIDGGKRIECVTLPDGNLYVPCSDTAGQRFVAKSLSMVGSSVLFIGLPGAGKTCSLQVALAGTTEGSFDHMVFGADTKSVSCTGKLNCSQLSLLLESWLATYNGTAFPKRSKALNVILDDLSLPDIHSSPSERPASELVRQILSTKASYGDHCTLSTISGLTLHGTCSYIANNDCRVGLSDRLIRLFNPLIVPPPSTSSLVSIYLAKFKRHWNASTPAAILGLTEGVVGCMVAIYDKMRLKVSPSVHSPHSLVSLHSLEEIFRGITLMPIKDMDSHTTFVQSFLFETTNVLTGKLLDTDLKLFFSRSLRDYMVEFFGTDMPPTLRMHFSPLVQKMAFISSCGDHLDSLSTFPMDVDHVSNMKGFQGLDAKFAKFDSQSLHLAYIEDMITIYNSSATRPIKIPFTEEVSRIVSLVSARIMQPNGKCLLLAPSVRGFERSLLHFTTVCSGLKVIYAPVREDFPSLDEAYSSWLSCLRRAVVYCVTVAPLVFVISIRDLGDYTHLILRDMIALLCNGSGVHLWKDSKDTHEVLVSLLQHKDVINSDDIITKLIVSNMRLLIVASDEQSSAAQVALLSSWVARMQSMYSPLFRSLHVIVSPEDQNSHLEVIGNGYLYNAGFDNSDSHAALSIAVQFFRVAQRTAAQANEEANNSSILKFNSTHFRDMMEIFVKLYFSQREVVANKVNEISNILAEVLNYSSSVEELEKQLTSLIPGMCVFCISNFVSFSLTQ